MLDPTGTLEHIQEYYGQILQNKDDLKTSACCSADPMDPRIKAVLQQIDDEIKDKFYGCGSPIPPELSGRTVLDLGCGTGRDVYVVSKLVGPEGRVIGVDMTEQQLEVGRRHLWMQMEKFGFDQPNVEFHQGYIEDLASLGLEDNSIDVVISNCVINLSPDKRRVCAEIFRVLKPGGELFFSDIFAGRRVPADLQHDAVVRGECLGGAMYIEDFRRLMRDIGCPDYRVMSKSRINLASAELEAKVGMIDFYSMTVRAFKLDSLEDICEDYGQVAVYEGTLAESPHAFMLDDHHTFHAGKPMLVCGNTAAMVRQTRYARHFEVHGERSTHFGPFDCSEAGRCEADPLQSGLSCC